MNELVKMDIEEVSKEGVIALFSDKEKLDGFLRDMFDDAEAMANKADAGTPKGLEALKSIAYKLVCTKSKFKARADQTTAEAKALVDGVRKGIAHINDAIDLKASEIRAPYAEAEAKKKAKAHRINFLLELIESIKSKSDVQVLEISDYLATHLPEDGQESELHDKAVGLVEDEQSQRKETAAREKQALIDAEAQRVENERLTEEAEISKQKIAIMEYKAGLLERLAHIEDADNDFLDEFEAFVIGIFSMDYFWPDELNDESKALSVIAEKSRVKIISRNEELEIERLKKSALNNIHSDMLRFSDFLEINDYSKKNDALLCHGSYSKLGDDLGETVKANKDLLLHVLSRYIREADEEERNFLKLEAEAKAKKDAEEAARIAAEKKEKEKKADEEAEQARINDEAHRDAIKAEAVKSIMGTLEIDERLAKDVIDCIASGVIAHTKIIF